MRFVLETLDDESLPTYDWTSSQKVSCTHLFKPAQTNPGPTSHYPPNMKPTSYFELVYDNEFLQKVRNTNKCAWWRIAVVDVAL